MNHWVMAFPYLMYLTSVGTWSSPPQTGCDTLTNTTDLVLGIAGIYYDSGMRIYTTAAATFNTSYISTCLSLNILLTLMIVIRLTLHIRNIRKAAGVSCGPSELHATATAVVTMLIESYALYAATLLLYIIPWALYSPVAYIFSEAISTTQVRAVRSPFPRSAATLGHC